MANAVFDKGREAFLAGGINWGSDTIKVAGCSSGYTANLSTHQFLSDVTNIQATTVALTGKTGTAGVAKASNSVFAAATGSAITQLVIYKDTGTASTSPLIARIDTATGLPVTPNGGDINITWDTGSNGIFKL